MDEGDRVLRWWCCGTGEVAEFAKWRNFRDEPRNITPHRAKMVKRDLQNEFKKADQFVPHRHRLRDVAHRLRREMPGHAVSDADAATR